MEMLRELGFCNGIENYSRILDGREPGERPYCLLDFFPDDFVCFIDESHQTVPQIGGMFEGDRSRKKTLVDYGFRLPSALDNRPQTFDEFLAAHAADRVRLGHAGRFRAQPLVADRRADRPPDRASSTREVDVRETKNQIDDLMEEIRKRVEAEERTLVTTLTKKMAEDLTDYLLEYGFKVRYLHSEIDTLERIQIIRELRLGEFDILVGREPAARGARPARGVARGDPRRGQGGLPARRDLADPDDRPRGAQHPRHGDHVRRPGDGGHAQGDRGDRPPPRDPGGLQRGARHHAGDDPEGHLRHHRLPDDGVEGARRAGAAQHDTEGMSAEEIRRTIVELEEEMLAAADDLRFEYAAKLRDEIKPLRRELDEAEANL